MPSVQALAAARGALHRVDRYIERTVLTNGTIAQGRVDEYLGEMNTSIDRYEALPTFPNERDLSHGLDDARRSVETSMRTLIAHATTPERGSALLDEIEQVSYLDDILTDLVEFNSRMGAQFAHDAEVVRTRSMRIAALFDGIALLLAVVATVFAVVIQRRTVQSLEHGRDTARQRATELEELATELEMFPGRVAHDLRGPLMSMSLTLESMRRQSKETQKLDRMLRSLSRMRHLVDGLLEFAHAGARPDLTATSDLAEVVRSCIDEAQPSADAGRIEIQVHEFKTRRLRCSTGVLSSVIGNLVGNAIKYMEGDERRVELSVTGGAASTTILIADTGPGIPEELRVSVFDPFVRASLKTEGVGLGLATVKRLVEAHGGTIDYGVGSHKGTTFRVTLPNAEGS
jgi:signal transduction histidine kinase